MVQARDKWNAIVNMVTNLHDPQNARNSLTKSGTISFSAQTTMHWDIIIVIWEQRAIKHSHMFYSTLSTGFQMDCISGYPIILTWLVRACKFSLLEKITFFTPHHPLLSFILFRVVSLPQFSHASDNGIYIDMAPHDKVYTSLQIYCAFTSSLNL